MPAHADHHEDIGEIADHNRRHAHENVAQEEKYGSEVPAAKLGKINSRRNPRRHGQENAAKGNYRRAFNGIEQASGHSLRGLRKNPEAEDMRSTHENEHE